MLNNTPTIQHKTPFGYKSPTEKIEEHRLTLEEKSRLRECEKVISIGLHAFVEVGSALLEIRNQRLYRTNHANFEQYCKDRWQLKRQRAYEMMEAADVVQSLHKSMSDIADKLPQKESHAAQLGKVPAEERSKVWKEVIDLSESSHQPITAKRIAEAVNVHKNYIHLSDEAPRVLLPLPPPNPVILPKQEEKRLGETETNALILQIKAKLLNATPREIMVQVSGKWLIRNKLAEVWKLLRHIDKHVVITEDYKDYLSLDQARYIGIIENKS